MWPSMGRSGKDKQDRSSHRKSSFCPQGGKNDFSRTRRAWNECAQLLSQGLEIPTNRLVRIPVLYEIPHASQNSYSPVRTKIPNAVNMIVLQCENHEPIACIPNPFFLPFEIHMVNEFTRLGFFGLEFVNMSEVSQAESGYAHCATNVRRTRKTLSPPQETETVR